VPHFLAGLASSGASCLSWQHPCRGARSTHLGGFRFFVAQRATSTSALAALALVGGSSANWQEPLATSRPQCIQCPIAALTERLAERRFYRRPSTPVQLASPEGQPNRAGRARQNSIVLTTSNPCIPLIHFQDGMRWILIGRPEVATRAAAEASTGVYRGGPFPRWPPQVNWPKQRA
jgi:hypothetical protein